MAARELPKNLSFLVIDSKNQIGLPLRCGEGVREKEFLQFFRHKNYSFIENTVSAHKIVYDNLKRSVKVNFLELDRPKFEKFLAEPIKGKIRLNTNCKDITIKKDYAEIATSKGTIKAKLLILANGANYHLQKKLNLIKKDPCLIVGYGGIYRVNHLNKDNFCYFFEKNRYGYLWIFPKNKHLANIGYGSLEDKNPKKTIQNLLKKHKLNAKQIKEYAGIVSVSGPIKKTYKNRILVCGTAAGFVYAGTGEGIQFALESGRIAANIAKKAVSQNNFSESFLKRYESMWKKSFGSSMKAGITFRDILYFAVRKNIVKKLFKIPTEKELRSMVLEGKTPLKASIFWHIISLFRI